MTTETIAGKKVQLQILKRPLFLMAIEGLAEGDEFDLGIYADLPIYRIRALTISGHDMRDDIRSFQITYDFETESGVLHFEKTETEGGNNDL